MSERLTGLQRALSASLWAIQPERLHHIIDLARTAVVPSVEREDLEQEAALPLVGATGGNRVAVIPVQGTIALRSSLWSWLFGGASTIGLGRMLDAALADQTVSAIVLDVDSPGGTVEGVEELSQKIAAARGQKPIVAVANACMCSAAYWIASAADEVIATPSASVGSIGVFAVHTDVSRAADQAGIDYTILRAGKFKAEGLPIEPLSDEARAAFQERIDETYEMFVARVAANRGIAAAAVRGGYGEGRALSAKQAKRAGMVDRIDTLDATIARLVAGKGPKSKARAVAAAEPVRADDMAPTTGGCDCGDCGADCPCDGDCGPDCECSCMATTNVGEATSGADPSTLAMTAPEAEEHTVSGNNTAVQNGAATTAAPDRFAAFAELAEMHGKTLADVRAWMSAGKSVEDVRADLLASYAASAKPIQRPTSVTNVVDREADRGFASFGEQMVAVVQAAKPGGRLDRRLLSINAAASGMNESVGSEGGFFIQPDLLPGVIDPVYEDDPILSRVTRIPIGANSNGVKYNVVDETSRATGSRWGGIQMYWAAEADTATAKKPKLRQMVLDLKKLIGIGYVTEEQMQDAPAAEALLTRSFQAELRFMLGDGIFRGTGAGQMLGFLNSGALVTQAIEGSQTIANTAASISLNVTKMLSRVPAGLWSNAIWLYNQELLPYIVNATTGSSGAVPLFVGAGGLANQPSDTILGRPAFASELCEAVGTPGDLLLVVPSEYHMADKGGPQQSLSVHVRFLYDEQTLKITYRCDGAPVWRQTLTPYKGANARSPFVALAQRS